MPSVVIVAYSRVSPFSTTLLSAHPASPAPLHRGWLSARCGIIDGLTERHNKRPAAPTLGILVARLRVWGTGAGTETCPYAPSTTAISSAGACYGRRLAEVEQEPEPFIDLRRALRQNAELSLYESVVTVMSRCSRSVEATRRPLLAKSGCPVSRARSLGSGSLRLVMKEHDVPVRADGIRQAHSRACLCCGQVVEREGDEDDPTPRRPSRGCRYPPADRRNARIARRRAEPLYIPLLGPAFLLRRVRHEDNDPHSARAADRDVLIKMQAVLLIDGPGDLYGSQVCAHDASLSVRRSPTSYRLTLPPLTVSDSHKCDGIAWPFTDSGIQPRPRV